MLKNSLSCYVPLVILLKFENHRSAGPILKFNIPNSNFVNLSFRVGVIYKTCKLKFWSQSHLQIFLHHMVYQIWKTFSVSIVDRVQIDAEISRQNRLLLRTDSISNLTEHPLQSAPLLAKLKNNRPIYNRILIFGVQ